MFTLQTDPNIALTMQAFEAIPNRKWARHLMQRMWAAEKGYLPDVTPGQARRELIGSAIHESINTPRGFYYLERFSELRAVSK